MLATRSDVASTWLARLLISVEALCTEHWALKVAELQLSELLVKVHIGCAGAYQHGIARVCTGAEVLRFCWSVLSAAAQTMSTRRHHQVINTVGPDHRLIGCTVTFCHPVQDQLTASSRQRFDIKPLGSYRLAPSVQ